MSPPPAEVKPVDWEARALHTLAFADCSVSLEWLHSELSGTLS